MIEGASDRSPADRLAVERTSLDLVLTVVRRERLAGVAVAIEGAPGIGKSFLATRILERVPSGAAKVLRAAGERGRRSDPLVLAGQILGELPAGRDPAEAAFDRVDELCADGPVVLCVEDAHHLDAASLALLRQLVWASRRLPLALLVTTRPDPAREQLDMLMQQLSHRLLLPPMSTMMVERLIYDRTGRWPGPTLRRVLALGAGNPLFVGELLLGYQRAGALTQAGTDVIEARSELAIAATGLDEVVRAHLGQLDEPTREVLSAMAVWGAEIGPGELASTLFTSAQALTPLIERAIASGLVRRGPSGTVGFTHDLFREVAYGELPGPRRQAAHRRAAQVLTATGHSPALVADHLVQAASPGADPALVTALHQAVAATRAYAPQVSADLLDEAASVGGADLPGALLLERAEALFTGGRGESAEALIRDRITAVTDHGVAARLQLTLIRSLANRADTAAALAAIERTARIAGLPGPALRQLETLRAWLLVLAGRPLPAAELDAMMARCIAAADQDAQASILSTIACTAFLAGRPDRALELMRVRDELSADAGSFRFRSSALVLPAIFELAWSGPGVAQSAIDRARRLSAERHAGWVDPFLGFTAGGIAFAAGDWDSAVAELDSALELAQETGAGWISLPAGVRSYIDAHRGDTAAARARLDSFRHRGLPLQFAQDRPGWAELAVLEAQGSIREAATLARTLWTAVRDQPGRWAADLAPDAARVAAAAMDRQLSAQIGDQVAALCPAEVTRLVRGMLAADPDPIESAAGELAAAGRRTAETFAREELACAAAAAGDRDRATLALDAAVAGYQRMGAAPDRDRALARMRALGIRRGPRQAHRTVVTGWAALTTTEIRIAELVCGGLTNREIGTRAFISPRTVQTHVSHILRKTGLRSRVEIARAAGGEIGRLADVSADRHL